MWLALGPWDIGNHDTRKELKATCVIELACYHHHEKNMPRLAHWFQEEDERPVEQRQSPAKIDLGRQYGRAGAEGIKPVSRWPGASFLVVRGHPGLVPAGA